MSSKKILFIVIIPFIVTIYMYIQIFVCKCKKNLCCAKRLGRPPPPLSDATCLFTAVLRSLDAIFTNFINKSLFLFALLSKITDIFHFLIVQPLNLIYKTIIYDRKCFNFIFFFDSTCIPSAWSFSPFIQFCFCFWNFM